MIIAASLFPSLSLSYTQSKDDFLKLYEKAVKYAEIASKADSSWADPDFVLGWYGLLLSKGNAEEYLCSAIEKDHRVLFRISNNDVCKQYPHIINKLKSRYTDTEVSSDSN